MPAIGQVLPDDKWNQAVSSRPIADGRDVRFVTAAIHLSCRQHGSRRPVFRRAILDWPATLKREPAVTAGWSRFAVGDQEPLIKSPNRRRGRPEPARAGLM